MSEQLISISRSRFDFESKKKTLAEKYEAKLTFAHSGGLWKAGPILLATLSVCSTPTVVILDLYGTPVRVDVEEMTALVFSHWQEQMNAWLNESSANGS